MDSETRELIKELLEEIVGQKEEEYRWAIDIERAGNGFLLRFIESAEIGGTLERLELMEDSFEESDFTEDSLKKAKTAERLCYKILDYFCLDGNKHDEYRIRIKVEHQNPPEGEKVHDEEED
jgi:hypothetical protein